MSADKIFILGIGVSILNLKRVLEEVKKYLEKIKNQKSKIKSEEINPLIIFTPNPEIVIYAQEDPNFKELVNSAQIAIPDGQGLVWASKILGEMLPERVTGTDLMEQLAKLAAEKGLNIGLIGGRERVAVRAMECLQNRYPGLKGEVFESPIFKLADNSLEKVESIKYQEASKKRDKILTTYYLLLTTNKQPIETQDYFERLVREIAAKKIGILFVGMGAPKQEYFIYHLSSIIYRPIILMAVGGAFDYISGNTPRAPLGLRKLGFEWAFRLIREPWRWRRQLALAKFILLVLREKIS